MTKIHGEIQVDYNNMEQSLIEMFEEMKWFDGDIIQYSLNEDGSISIEKKNK